MAADSRKGSILDKKADLEGRYVSLLEKRIAALEALLPASVRTVQPTRGEVNRF